MHEKQNLPVTNGHNVSQSPPPEAASPSLLANSPYELIHRSLQPINTAMRCGLFLMTYEMAAYILEHLNHPNNRNKKIHRIEVYKADMLAKMWLVCHQGIAFSDEGWLIDGQNRLQAIVDAKVNVPMLVFFDVPKEAMRILDSGVPRNLFDAVRVGGDLDITPRHIPTAKRMIMSIGAHLNGISGQHVLDFLDEHREAIDFAVHAFASPEPQITVAAVHGVVARAFYTQNLDRLSKFCVQLRTGMPENPEEDQAAIGLRNLLKREGCNNGGQATASAYRKIERCLVAFMAKEKLSNIYEVKTEQFPLPIEMIKPTK